MQDIKTAQAVDPIFMGNDGQFYFPDNDAPEKAYGPYPDAANARQNLNAYTEWYQSQNVPKEVIDTAEKAKGAIEQAVAEYIELRDRKGALTKAHDETVAEIDEQLKRGEAFLMDALTSMGVESVKVSQGTVFTKSQTRAGIQDKGAFCEWVRANGQVELFQARVAQGELEKWMEANGDTIPPGVNYSKERVVQIRRK